MRRCATVQTFKRESEQVLSAHVFTPLLVCFSTLEDGLVSFELCALDAVLKEIVL